MPFSDVPSPAAAQARRRSPPRPRDAPGSLPAELTRFVGRRTEAAELQRLLAVSRLVTLTGAGGAGKTRLALHVAGRLRRTVPDGVWFVDLAQVWAASPHRDGPPELNPIASAVMSVLGAREQGGESPVRQVTAYLRDRQVTLVLDGCETLTPAVATLLHGLLDDCAGLRVLATSREPLALRGEQAYAVSPLPTPGPGEAPGPADVATYDSVALFVDRAQAVQPDFRLTAGNVAEVAALCRRTDGLPLAIELAAARVRVLAPGQILARLTDRFALLTRGGHLAPARHQTLRACVEWSFDLCGKPERLLWARLAVFVGGFDLEAAEAVCADDVLAVADVGGALAGLVEKSIVDRGDPDDGTPARYRLLDTIRDYGREQLGDEAEWTALCRRHRDWCLRLLDRANAEWVGPRQAGWYARLSREHPNVRAAVELCLAEPDGAEAALRILVNLPRLCWWQRGAWSEGLDWLGRALARATAPSAVRARGLVLAADLAAWQGDADAVERLLSEGERVARQVGDRHALALAAFVHSNTALHRNDVAGSAEAAERGLGLLPVTGERDLDLRLALLLTLGGYALHAGDQHGARRRFREVLEITEPRGENVYRSTASWGLGLVAWRDGADEEAAQRLTQAIRIEAAAGRQDRYITALSVEVLAWVAAGAQDHERAATLLAAAGSLLTAAGRPLPAMLDADHVACERDARDRLGAVAFAAAFGHGRGLSPEELTGSGAGAATPGPAREPGGDGAGLLTARERQIAELVARGLSSKEIARTLTISPRTVESHLDRIFARLGFSNRAQVAAWVEAQSST
jgi:predicted ATPase/DNA-binding CsgD family transcriptional regulator